MKGAAFWCGALATVLCSAASVQAASKDVTDLDRTWANFTREAAVLGDRRLWIELRGMILDDDIGGPQQGLNGYPVRDFERDNGDRTIDEIQGGRFDLIGAYGLTDHWELGMDLPFLIQQQIEFTDDTFQNDAAPGDMVVYGKFKHMFDEHWAGALGLEMDLPTGDEDKLLGSGDLGLNPFVSTRYQYGRVAVGAHLGFLANTADQASVFNWSVQGIARGNEMFALRVEFNGRFYRDVGRDFNDIAVYPGIDFNLTDNIIIRPEGLAHLTDDAIDWGIGLGLVFTMALAPAPPPPAPEPPPVAAPPPPMKKKIVLRGVNFDFDKSNIRPDAEPILETACNTLKSEPSIDVSCDGYTDSIGTEEYNQALSERRAGAVRSWLTECGIAPSRLTTRGFGESNPVASNETDEGRAQNRRTELVVTNQ